ncbi:MAG: YmdB family metallophosphoesterase, partial [Oscillospiraceae bacterium]|nr:YmdB family metallophosphoesterase [Oscillospiraceae bacterium]
MSVNILAIGDVCGTGGLKILRSKLRAVQKFNNIAFTVVNGENASGLGVTPAQCEDIFSAGADAITLGNHTWGRHEIEPYLDDCPYIFRPSNYAPQVPGRGFGIVEAPFGDVCVINLIGRCGMNFGPENPFYEADRIIKKTDAKVILIDFHAEATSEKAALAYYLDGRVSAVWGTHTHVQTSDGCVLPGGTGFITDVGMTGAISSVIGIEPAQSVSMFLGNPPQRYEQAKGPCKIEGAIFEID